MNTIEHALGNAVVDIGKVIYINAGKDTSKLKPLPREAYLHHFNKVKELAEAEGIELPVNDLADDAIVLGGYYANDEGFWAAYGLLLGVSHCQLKQPRWWISAYYAIMAQQFDLPAASAEGIKQTIVFVSQHLPPVGSCVKSICSEMVERLNNHALVPMSY